MHRARRGPEHRRRPAKRKREKNISFPRDDRPYGGKRQAFPTENALERIRIEIVSISMLTLPSHYGKSVVFPCVRLRVVALATTRAIHIFNVELL